MLLKKPLRGDAFYIAETLRRGRLGIGEVLRESPLPEGSRLLIFVDQFEEIFRFRNDGPLSVRTDDEKERVERRSTRERWANESEAFVALLDSRRRRTRT